MNCFINDVVINTLSNSSLIISAFKTLRRVTIRFTIIQ